MLQKLIVLGEKTFWTFLEVFLTVLVGADQIGASTAQAAAIAAVSAALTVIANGLPEIELVSDNAFVDAIGRIVRTAAASFIGFLVAAPVLDLSPTGLQAAAVATVPAVISAVKSAGSAKVGSKQTAAALPSQWDVTFNRAPAAQV